MCEGIAGTRKCLVLVCRLYTLLILKKNTFVWTDQNSFLWILLAGKIWWTVCLQHNYKQKTQTVVYILSYGNF